MLKQYRNLLFDIIQEKGLNPRIFEPEETSYYGREAFSIILKDSPIKFVVCDQEGSYHNFKWAYTYFVPDFHMAETSTYVNGDNLISTFTDWLENHVKLYIKETTGPDLWQLLESEAPLISTSEISEQDTMNITEDEKQRIRMSIDEFRILLISNYKPTNDQLNVINNRLKYLSEAAERLNRIDWRSIAIVTIMQIIMILSLDTEIGRSLFELFQQVFSDILQLLS